jgi:hypothetical protein
MAKKDKLVIARTEEFSEIDSELSNAMEQLDETNMRIEALLQAHAKPDVEPADMTTNNDDTNVSA